MGRPSPTLGRRDGNEREIIEALKQVGCDVRYLNWPADLLVGNAGRNYLLEVKDPEQPPSKRGLTTVEKEFHDNWRGQVAIVETIEEALEAVGLRRKR